MPTKEEHATGIEKQQMMTLTHISVTEGLGYYTMQLSITYKLVSSKKEIS
jgi:hypothetical protein